MRGWLTTILTLIIIVGAFGQAGQVPLRLRKILRDKLDDLVYEIQVRGRLSSEEERDAFRALFAEDALVFDYITPNYVTRNVGQELNKPIDQFLEDVRRDFPKGFMQSSIIDSNLGEAVSYRDINWASPSVTIQIALSVFGEYLEGGQFSNRPVLDVVVEFDTLNQQVVNFSIASIAKVNSELRYQKEERAPKFEKQILSGAFDSWNTAIIDQTDGDYFIDNLSISPDRSYAVSFNLIRLIAAPEPEEFSYSIGVGYTVSNFKINVDNYFYSFLTTDRENDAVYRNVAGSQLTESVSSELIEIPVRFRYERKLSRVFSVYANVGLSLSYLLRSAYDGSGVFSYSGYYPKYNLVMTEVESYGFVNNRPEAAVFETGIVGFSRDHLGMSGLADLGMNIETKNGLVFYLGASAFKGIVKTERIQSFQLISAEMGEFNGILPVINSFNFGGYGLQFGIRKRFRSRNGLVKMEKVINGQ